MHIVDETAAEDGMRLLSLLLQHLPPAEVDQEVLMIGLSPPALRVPAGVPVHRVGRRFGWTMASLVDVQRVLKKRCPELVHAWSSSAWTVASIAAAGRATVTLTDPAEARTAGRWWRSAGPRARGLMVCSATSMQRKLVEAGVPIEATTIIRPGVDFAAIREAKSRVRREDLGLPPHGRVLLTVSPPSRAGGQLLAVWAMAMLNQIWPDARMLIPGESREAQRLLRLIRQINCPQVYLPVGNRYNPAELMAVADALITPANDDIPTAWLAWAMAAGVPVIGSATPAIAELIADRHNGFLCRPGEVHTLAIRIRTAMESPDLGRCIETARGQAYDVFRAQACVDQYLRLFKNLQSGRPPAEGVRDMAMDT
ncbi:MAG TPA: glycosyltransferase family 4 protein [Phycisphaerae bacterium]|jgi:glycosyltransferase involved in cell wall biosynthesis|nr:glycosyltransferase family 4 protein [Phycisphaerae bacterium]HOB76480.1 glycosyltransferase family 4 protein [Phycisphaerae bacterium]HOJ56511.1 glycosyltransferase family 4 protein [Phycisphaerae bacterium]HOL28331.1 glycosyltransferase family 4 protein [Phycisphaerae bacterium]HPP22699.1 glycosyltransferase family 4 protein [Phycisphaerae bacterium]